MAGQVSRHRVARGALTAIAMRSVPAGSAPACRYRPRLIAATAPAFPKAIQGVLAQARVARLGVGERRRQRAQRLRRSSLRHRLPNLVPEQLCPQIITCEHLFRLASACDSWSDTRSQERSQGTSGPGDGSPISSSRGCPTRRGTHEPDRVAVRRRSPAMPASGLRRR